MNLRVFEAENSKLLSQNSTSYTFPGAVHSDPFDFKEGRLIAVPIALPPSSAGRRGKHVFWVCVQDEPGDYKVQLSEPVCLQSTEGAAKPVAPARPVAWKRETRVAVDFQ